MEKNRKFHSFLLTLVFSFLAWVLVNRYVINISIYQFIIIEIFMAFMESFSTFIKEKTGLEKGK
jgi:hypothetical protein